jgi:hypothetical protein
VVEIFFFLRTGITFSTVMRYRPIFWLIDKVGRYHIHYCLKCSYDKNVVVASLDAEIYSVVQGDRKTSNRLCQKKSFEQLLHLPTHQ